MPKAVILAGGLGKRLRPLTGLIPKPLLPVGGSSILEIQIKTLKKYGFKEIFIAPNYLADQVVSSLGNGEKYGVQLAFSKENEPLGTYGPVMLLKKELTEPFILMNGDILTTLDFKAFYNFAISNKALLTAATKQLSMPLEFGKIVAKGKHIVSLEEKPDFKPEILAGIYVIKPQIFDIIPVSGRFGMDQLIKEMLRRNLKIAKYHIDDYWLDIGRVSDYTKAQADYHKHFRHLKK